MTQSITLWTTLTTSVWMSLTLVKGKFHLEIYIFLHVHTQAFLPSYLPIIPPSLKMQSAWENYRHLIGTSEAFSVAPDGVTCYLGPQPTSAPQPPTPPPTNDPTASPTPCVGTSFRADVLTDNYPSGEFLSLLNYFIHPPHLSEPHPFFYCASKKRRGSSGMSATAIKSKSQEPVSQRLVHSTQMSSVSLWLSTHSQSLTATATASAADTVMGATKSSTTGILSNLVARSVVARAHRLEIVHLRQPHPRLYV